MFHGDRSVQFLLFGCLFSFVAISPTLAQITPDNTLGAENSVVTENVTIKDAVADLIKGGAIRDNNLFHSFLEFNVPDGNRVYFASPDGIANILTRVTGNNLSEIFGTLGVLKDTASHIDGTANLFLLNPNGIVFGENAALDVNGSFLATTAESYIFENGFEYSASNPETPPLLTINIPVGLQFGSQAESIVNQSFSFNDFDELVGLEVSPEENITLIGGDILFEGGTVTASNGSIEIGSVAPNSLMKIIPTENNWTLDYTGINNFQDLNLTQAASINSSGDGAGNINIQANNLNVLESSAIVADNYGEQDGGSITINAQESVTVNGMDANFVSSRITTNVYDSGKGADLNINTKTLQVADGAGITAENYGTGDGGDITIKASDSVNLVVSQEGEDDYPGVSRISSDVYNSGDGGDINIETRTLEINSNTYISSDVLIEGDVLDMGDGGDVRIKASDSVILDGFDNSEGDISWISSEVLLFTNIPLEELGLEPNSANGGNLTIETETLRVTDGSYILTENEASGRSGNLTINASELVEVIGNSVEGSELYSSISSSSWGSADAGELTISTKTLRIANHASVESSALGRGDGGTITVNAERVILKDDGQLGVGTDNYEQVNGGNGGNLTVNASEFVEVSGVSSLSFFEEEEEVLLTSSSLFADTFNLSGNGGNIVIKTPQLKLFDGGRITSNTNGVGNGGNIDIDADTIIVSDSIKVSFGLFAESNGTLSGISSVVGIEGSGKGGNINISTDNLQLVDGGLISVNTLGEGNAGNINIQADKLNIAGVSSGEPVFGTEQESLPSQISAFSQGDFAAGLININTDTLNLSNQGNISVSNLGNGDSGNLNITANQLNLDDSATIEAKVYEGNRGNINLATDNIFLRNNSEINAKASSTATGGNITINNTENIVLLENSQIIADAVEGNGGNINITTQGLFVSPNSKISASSEFGLDGNINVETLNGDRPIELKPLPIEMVDATQQIAVSCSVGKNTFAIAGQGGLPENPTQNFRGQTIWQDLRLLTDNAAQLTSNSLSLPEYPYISTIIEAQTWQVNPQGKVELMAIKSNNSRSSFSHNTPQCSQITSN